MKASPSMMGLITRNVEMGYEEIENEVEPIECASCCEFIKGFSSLLLNHAFVDVGGRVRCGGVGKFIISVDFVCLCVSFFLVCYWLVFTDSVACGLALGEV